MSNKDFPKLSFKQGKRINLNYAIRSWFDKIGVEVLGHFIPEEKVKMVDSIKWTADLIEQNGKSVQIAERFRNHPYQFYVQDQEGLSNYCAVVPDKSAFFRWTRGQCTHNSKAIRIRVSFNSVRKVLWRGRALIPIRKMEQEWFRVKPYTYIYPPYEWPVDTEIHICTSMILKGKARKLRRDYCKTDEFIELTE